MVLREIKQQLADTKKSTEERMIQGQQNLDETQEAWQEAVARASEAEERARKLEQTISNLQEQLQVNQIHQQLWPPHQPEPTVTQVVQNSSSDTLMNAPAVQVAGNSSHDTTMEEPPLNNDDTEMSEVNRVI